MNIPKWKRFEELVAKVQKTFVPDAKITLDDKITGVLSGVPRQVDISIRQKIGQFEILIAIDCKDHSVPIDVKHVEEFIGLVQDIDANKGVLVSASGFTSTAITRGEKAGLEMYRLVDAEPHEWQATVTIPVLCDFRGLRSYSLTLAGNRRVLESFNLDDVKNIQVYDERNESLGKIYYLLHKKWHDGQLPTQPGEYKSVSVFKNPTYVKYNEGFFRIKILCDFIIQKRLFLGHLPLTKVSGFQDSKTGGLITKEFTTDKLDMLDVESNWMQIESLDDFAVTPVINIEALDTYTGK
ncbi:restriction endonuclease [Caldithrix abyssi]|nr:restriction endonuclease [Caldithrix abyssi]